MHDNTPDTRWLDLIGDRADLGSAIVRLSRLAVATHLASHATANGLAGDCSADRLVNVASRDPAVHTEVPR